MTEDTQLSVSMMEDAGSRYTGRRSSILKKMGNRGNN